MFAQTYYEAIGRESIRSRFRALIRSSLLSAIGMLRQRDDTPGIRFFYCHYVFKDQREKFARILDYLGNEGTFVNTQEALSILRGDKVATHRCFHLSFDDGLRCVIQNAVPELERRCIPSTIFVPTGLIETPLDVLSVHRQLTSHAIRKVEHASWSELRDAQAAGVEIGSHTRSHKNLASIYHDESALTNELVGSKSDIEAHVGSPCHFISWPYGKLTDINASVSEFTRSAGYEACFGAFRQRICPGQTDLFRIPRHHFEPNWPITHLKAFANGFRE